MAYLPPKAKRQYQRPLWQTIKGNSVLIAHDCAKCKKSFDGKASGTWFERADEHGVWVWACEACFGNRQIQNSAALTGDGQKT
jgi:sulfur relay (sulfurtransferase) complex TusBCD TusD component (DsrE family)